MLCHEHKNKHHFGVDCFFFVRSVYQIIASCDANYSNRWRIKLNIKRQQRDIINKINFARLQYEDVSGGSQRIKKNLPIFYSVWKLHKTWSIFPAQDIVRSFKLVRYVYFLSPVPLTSKRFRQGCRKTTTKCATKPHLLLSSSQWRHENFCAFFHQKSAWQPDTRFSSLRKLRKRRQSERKNLLLTPFACRYGSCCIDNFVVSILNISNKAVLKLVLCTSFASTQNYRKSILNEWKGNLSTIQ